MDVFVAGGVHSLVFGNFQRNLDKFGIRILSHTPMGCKTYAGIPTGTEGVIIIKDLINHELSGKVVADAKVRGLPYAIVERKWSKAQPILTLSGIIKTPTHNNSTKSTDTKAVEDFITEIRKTSKRTATLSEVRGKFPTVTGDEYNDACGLALQQSTVPNQEVSSHIALVLAEDYSMVLDADSLFARTQTMFPEVASIVTHDLVRLTIQDTLATWRHKPSVREAAIRTFAHNRYRQFQKDGTGWIGWHDLMTVVKPIFGVGGDWGWFCEARAEVFGPWALRLVHLSQAIEDFNKQHPESKTMLSSDLARA